VLSRLIAGSARNPVIVGLLTVLLIGFGLRAVQTLPVDAIPDLSDVQVIVQTENPGQSPQLVEDRVTYPISTAMLSVPFAKVVRGYSFFGLSLVHVVFEDGTDLYWARSRVLEALNTISGELPPEAHPTLGPDATGVGWIYQYALVDRSGGHDLAQLRSIQDWYLRYELQTVPGVSEVASVGGFVKEYQVEVDPNALATYGIPLSRVRRAIEQSNREVGGRVVEFGESEFMVRGRGYLRGAKDLRRIALKTDRQGTPVYLGDVARVKEGPELRRGVTDLDGMGDVAAGIVIMRTGANALETIEAVKARLEELKSGLPEGVEIVTTYDRSTLIGRAIDTLRERLLEEIAIVALVCGLFLFHVRSALVAIVTLPLGILFSLILIQLQGLNANIMSLGGIAIAIGVMVDAAIVMVENAHKHLERAPEGKPRHEVVIEAAVEVGPSLFFSLLIVVVSFLPVFTLTGQAGRLFHPLAFTKTYAMLGAALISVTLVPLLMLVLVRGRILPEARNPINRLLSWIYGPLLHSCLKHPLLVAMLTLAIFASALYPYRELGSEFMPPLNEGDLLYMPSTLPGISITTAQQILQQTDRIIRQFPEVERVFGKIGRAETATDPAPLSMVETTITLKPESEWREGVTPESLTRELDRAIQIPGLTNIWTMPIKTRIDMLATGLRTKVGIKLTGPDLEVLQDLGERVEAILSQLPDTRSAVADRALGGHYLDFEIDREAIARHGLSIDDVQEVIQTAIGGRIVTQTVEGRERYGVSLRYPRELRDNLANLRRVTIPIPGGGVVPIEQVSEIVLREGPAMIKSEDARLGTWVAVDIGDIDVGRYVAQAREALTQNLEMPSGYSIRFAGDFEQMEQAAAQLRWVIPATLGIIALLLYLNFGRLSDTLIVLATVPFSLVGGFWLLWAEGYALSVAVAVGFIGLLGIATEIGVVLLVFLEASVSRRRRESRLRHRSDLLEAVREGAAGRVRPILMTVLSTLFGLVPILIGSGTGSEAMRRIAAPMVGGLFSATFLALFVIPVAYYLVRSWQLRDEWDE